MPVKYNKIDYDKISLHKPVKDGHYRKCVVEYDNEPFVIQTCKKMKVHEDKLCFCLNKKGAFYAFLDDIKTKIVELLVDSSFFSKPFTKEQIVKAITPLITVNEEGDGEIPIKDTSSTKWVNYFKENTESSFGAYGSCLIFVKQIVFYKNIISFDIDLISVRLDPVSSNTDTFLLEDELPHENPQELQEEQQELLEDLKNPVEDEHQITDDDPDEIIEDPIIVEEPPTEDTDNGVEDFFCD
jgi:hypothetical protein